VGTERSTGQEFDPIVSLTPIERHERAAIVDALRRVDGHVIDAARLLGLGQATVYRKIKQYAIPHVRRRRARAPR
jgi:transcriptional regulator of acetoin/glycerol metabolism